jgi:hypothetical protein
LLAKLALQRARQHGDAILVSLALADDDQAALEVQILHPQAQALHFAHAGSVEQPEDELVDTFGSRQEPSNFVSA